ncbi:hypothetical protein ACFE04_007384 [Oxalis oulophora]
MACSRMIWIHFINISSLILGLISIAWSLYTIVHGPTETLIYPLIIPGALITILSLSGLIGFGCCKSNVLIVINMVVIILAIVVVAVLRSLGFMAATTIRNGTHPSDSDLGFKEYRFGNYSNLFGRNISDNLYWNRVKTKYLIKAKVCSRLKDVNVTAGETLNHLTSIQNKNDHVIGGGGFLGPTICVVDATLLKQAHLYVLRNIVEVSTYVEEHMESLRHKSHLLRKGPQWVQNEHARTFIEWFSDKIRNAPESVHNIPKCAVQWVTQKQWDDFVVYVQSPEFEEESRKNREKRMNQEYQCYVGRNGMSGVEEEYVKKYGVIPERHESWKFARMNSKGEYINHRDEAVAGRIDELKEQRESGKLKLSNNEDILLKAIGREMKNGHMMACGPIATKSFLFPSTRVTGKTADIIRLQNIIKNIQNSSQQCGDEQQTEKKDPCVLEKKLSASQKRINELEEEIALLRKNQEPYIPKFETQDNDISEEAAKDDNHREYETTFDSEGPDARKMNDFMDPLLFGDSFPHKYSEAQVLPSWLDTEHPSGVPAYSEIPFLEKNCLLYALVDGIRSIVAIGRVVADGAATNEVVHFKVLSSNNYKVEVKFEIIGSAKVPTPGGEIELVREAVNSFVAWPKELVSFDKIVDELLIDHLSKLDKGKIKLNEMQKTEKQHQKKQGSTVKSERDQKSDKEDKEGNKDIPSSQVEVPAKKWKIKHVGFKPDKTYHTRGNANIDKPSSSQKQTTYLDQIRIWANVDGQRDATEGFVPDEIYGQKSNFFILTTGIKDFLTWNELDAGFVAAYLWYLHLKVERLGYSSLYGFANPVAIAEHMFQGKPTNTNGTVAVRAQRLSRFFAHKYVDNKTYFVPFLQM